jgi:hypothetical protein
VQLAHRHVGERLAGDVVLGDGLQDVARAGTPEAQAAQARGVVVQRHRPVAGQVAAHPAEVVLADRAAGHDEELVLADAGDREVAHDPPARREHRGVDDRARRPVDVVGGQVLQVGPRARATDGDLRERREVEQAGPLARRAVLGQDGG